MVRIKLGILFVAGMIANLQAQDRPLLTLTRTISLPAVSGRFDHMAFDPVSHRLFVAATGNHSVEVIDVEQGKVLERITGLGKPHGLAWIPDEGKLFVADGTLAALRVYSGSPLELTASLPLSDDADDVVYDEATKLLYVGHGGSDSANPARIAVVSTVNNSLIENEATSSHPEALEIDRTGKRIFANIADSAEVVVLDASSHRNTSTWKLATAKDNVPLAYDAEDQLLVLGCRVPATAVLLDAATGKELGSRPSSTGADDLFFEPSTRRVYLISSSGTVDVYKIGSDRSITTLGAVKTRAGAKTALLVPSLKTLFVALPAGGNQPAAIQMYTTAAK